MRLDFVGEESKIATDVVVAARKANVDVHALTADAYDPLWMDDVVSYSADAVTDTFGSWERALEQAGQLADDALVERRLLINPTKFDRSRATSSNEGISRREKTLATQAAGVSHLSEEEHRQLLEADRARTDEFLAHQRQIAERAAQEKQASAELETALADGTLAPTKIWVSFRGAVGFDVNVTDGSVGVVAEETDEPIWFNVEFADGSSRTYDWDEIGKVPESLLQLFNKLVAGGGLGSYPQL